MAEPRRIGSERRKSRGEREASEVPTLCTYSAAARHFFEASFTLVVAVAVPNFTGEPFFSIACKPYLLTFSFIGHSLIAHSTPFHRLQSSRSLRIRLKQPIVKTLYV